MISLDADARAAWNQDLDSPEIERIETVTDPRSRQVTSIEIAFSEPVVGLTLSAIRLFHGGQPVDLFGSASLSTADQMTWTLDDISGVTHAPGDYGLEVRSRGSGIRDLAGNLLPSGGTAAWQMGNAWHNHANHINQQSIAAAEAESAAVWHSAEFFEPLSLRPSVGPEVGPPLREDSPGEPPLPARPPARQERPQLRLRSRLTRNSENRGSHSLNHLDAVFAEWDHRAPWEMSLDSLFPPFPIPLWEVVTDRR